jgi:hypothetical protein
MRAFVCLTCAVEGFYSTYYVCAVEGLYFVVAADEGLKLCCEGLRSFCCPEQSIFCYRGNVAGFDSLPLPLYR